MKRWLLTGAGGGLGREIARLLLERGDGVAATARRSETLQFLSQAHGDERLTTLSLDLAQGERIPVVVDEAVAALGGLDGVIHCAGYALMGAAEEFSEAQIRHALEVNLTGPLLLLRAALPHLRAQRRGWIVHVSSEMGQTSWPALSVYHAAKWGMEGFCDSLARDVQKLGISVLIVEPGHIDTPFDDNAVSAMAIMDDYQRTSVGDCRRLMRMGRFPRIGDPRKMAQAIVAELVAPSPRRRLVLGSDAWRNVTRDVRARLAEVEAQCESAPTTDRGAGQR
jgi:NAD(P)-dependent dehydrogenase (short-subunit alcohol dehydrogenase family)